MLSSMLVSTPHFEDTETEIEDWAINYFHKETKEEIEWTIATCLLIYINETGNKVSHVVTNPTLKNFCLVKESSILGKEVMVTNHLDSVLGLTIEVTGIKMNPDCTVEEVLSNELDRLREDYIRAYNDSKSVTEIGQSMANIVTALALTYNAKNGGTYVS